MVLDIPGGLFGQDDVRETETITEISTGQFVDRGNATNEDFEEGVLTTNGTWIELDLSAIVPSGAKAVLIYNRILDGSTNQIFGMKTAGNASNFNVSNLTTNVANLNMEGDKIIPMPSDDSRKIEYRGSNTVFTAIDITVKGWWI